MAEIDVLQKEIKDIYMQLRIKNPSVQFVDGLVVNAKLNEDEREEIEKKLRRIKELENA